MLVSHFKKYVSKPLNFSTFWLNTYSNENENFVWNLSKNLLSGGENLQIQFKIVYFVSQS